MAEQLSIFEFGKQLVETMDLDPVYVMLWHAELDHHQLRDWLVAYWCFYHCGTASWIAEVSSEGFGYWDRLHEAAATKEHPRSSERRHFRGEAAVKAVRELRSYRLTCSELIEGLTDRTDTGAPLGLSDVVGRARKWRGFGHWIAFKVADMLERLAIAPVVFRPSDVFDMYDAPRKGAEEMAKRYKGSKANPYLWAYNKLKSNSKLNTLMAPPRFERSLNIQEIETILCKWKSHLSGHYTVGKDIAEVKHGLEKYSSCSRLAKQLLSAGVKGGLW